MLHTPVSPILRLLPPRPLTLFTVPPPQWGVVVIQKIARGYIARKTVVRAAKIRNGLSAPVLHLAERYMQKGDMWGFLREVEEGLARLQVRWPAWVCAACAYVC